MIFVDSSAWFASVVINDRHHERAVRWINSQNDLLLTTDYVVDETLTLLRARGEMDHALRMGSLWFEKNIAEFYKIQNDDIARAWVIFSTYKDKEWSFTDCTSKVVMEMRGVRKAFAFDVHFSQFGSMEVVP